MIECNYTLLFLTDTQLVQGCIAWCHAVLFTVLGNIFPWIWEAHYTKRQTGRQAELSAGIFRELKQSRSWQEFWQHVKVYILHSSLSSICSPTLANLSSIDYMYQLPFYICNNYVASTLIYSLSGRERVCCKKLCIYLIIFSAPSRQIDCITSNATACW